MVENQPASEGDIRDSGSGSLEKGMATHSSTVACEIPRTEEPGGL